LRAGLVALSIHSLSFRVYRPFTGGSRLSYSTTGIDGQAHFHYQDAIHSVDFSGPAIRTTASEIGTIVTVTIQLTVDNVREQMRQQADADKDELYQQIVQANGDPSSSLPFNRQLASEREPMPSFLQWPSYSAAPENVGERIDNRDGQRDWLPVREAVPTVRSR
jgi:hypothetical protein